MRILAASILYASLALGVGGCEQATGPSQVDTAEEDRRLMQAFDRRAEDTWVEAGGRVVRLLSDDHEGSRHQRFIVETGAGQTLLIAHNIDVAPRVPVGMGDRVRFRGVYEWNDLGGVIHWTHHDPRGEIEGGWIEFARKRYR